MTKKFLIQIESAADTRWLHDDKYLAARILAQVENLTTHYTEGTRPSVIVVKEEVATEAPSAQGGGWCDYCNKPGCASTRCQAIKRAK